ncbi:type I-E CRISPR-associated protein Cse2/CasB [Rothia mucilaginosa]|jgi:CRISPR system CASCADE complex protein casB|uniref:type I-E CRISPR-associated protein Cse2/CasB n=1 Tax=Rothia mucilaginosa TaxID=43675 RepID=UPI00066C7B3A|nr:type I-E CRISPR-associated protein Cse2/CasB [Rothia mucilaginosa]MBS5102404.1 type I-E CRISPR-associated protein Cse2/CasB [Rothia mucilaginosa]
MSDMTKQDALQRFVSTKINRLYLQKDAGVSAAIAELAQLRRGAGKVPTGYPHLMGMVLVLENEDKEDKQAFPEQCRGKGDRPNDAEIAAYTALTLFALHQQSQNQPMHDAKVSFGRAVGKLVGNTTSSMKKRFDSLLTAQTENARQHYLRSLITLLRSKSIAFNYGQFAVDYMYLQNPSTRKNVLYRWNSEFSYGLVPPRSEDSKTTE